MQYSVVDSNPKVLSILLDNTSSLQDVVSLAVKEFPSVSLDKLQITPTGNNYFIYLQEKRI